MGPNTMWFKDGNTGAADINIALATYNAGFTARHSHLFKTPTYDNKSRFRVAVTLSDIFLFCEDFWKIIYGFKHSLTMERSSDQ